MSCGSPKLDRVLVERDRKLEEEIRELARKRRHGRLWRCRRRGRGRWGCRGRIRHVRGVRGEAKFCICLVTHTRRVGGC